MTRPQASPRTWDKDVPVSDDDNVFVLLTPEMTFSGFSVDNATFALSRDQVAQFEEIAERRRGLGYREHSRSFTRASKPRDFSSNAGDTWSYVVSEEGLAQIVGVASTSKALAVPAQIEGAVVVSIAAHALSANEHVEEIVCPDTVEDIGPGAFRLNPNLRRVVLPSGVRDFKSSWISRCPELEELVLPGMLERIDHGVLECKGLKRLFIGRNVSSIEPGAFQGSNLDEIVVDYANPFITTDGDAIYTADGTTLVALARPVRALAVAPGCRTLAKKCCYGFEGLEAVSLPDTVAEVGEFAFAYSGLADLEAPASLRAIGNKAFFSCRALRYAHLNAGLATIGDSAFEGTALSELVIPASITHFGRSATRGTAIVHSGPNCSIAIEEGCADLFLDDGGGLYRVREDGAHLTQLVDSEAEFYTVFNGAVAIDAHAFAFHDRICSVRVPASVRTIGKSAFRVCRNLRHVELPDSVQSIGAEAFLDTNIEEIRIPANLRELGERALVTYGAHHGTGMQSLVRIEVAPGNDAFYMASGMLCRKTDAGASVVAYAGPDSHVVFPDEITRVEEFAFSNARGIECLELNARLSSIGTKGLSTSCWIRRIHVERAEPVEGRTAFDFFFPDTPGAIRGIALGLGGSSWVNVPGIVEQLDICLVNARDYNSPRRSGNISAYAQAKLILERLDDPVMLTRMNRIMQERVLRNNIEDICVDVALHDDRAVLDELIERGFVNAGNLDAVIERVNTLRDAASTAYLLEAKREKFARPVFDYDL